MRVVWRRSKYATTDAQTVDALGVEDCFNGIDDNGDGIVDCADPQCKPVKVCVAVPTGGWLGLGTLYDGSAGGAPTCADPFAMTMMPGSDGLTSSPATCGACLCSAASGGACASGGGSATLPPVSWTGIGASRARPRRLDTAGCTNEMCVPRAGSAQAASATSGLCIHQSGDLACPTGTPFTARHVFYRDDSDDRDCSLCTCGAPSGSVCAPAGGSATGSATGSDAETYCCAP